MQHLPEKKSRVAHFLHAEHRGVCLNVHSSYINYVILLCDSPMWPVNWPYLVSSSTTQRGSLSVLCEMSLPYAFGIFYVMLQFFYSDVNIDNFGIFIFTCSGFGVEQLSVSEMFCV